MDEKAEIKELKIELKQLRKKLDCEYGNYFYYRSTKEQKDEAFYNISRYEEQIKYKKNVLNYFKKY